MTIKDSSLQFLVDLDRYNTRAWLQENEHRYREAKDNFKMFVQHLIGGIQAFDHLGPLEASQCLFRINRDMRFVKDDRPYHTHFSAIISPAGKKAPGAYYYLRIKPGSSVLKAETGCRLSKAALEGLRRQIDHSGDQLQAIVQSATFSNFFPQICGEEYKKIPSPYSSDHPFADWLIKKQFVAEYHVSDSQVTSSSFPDHALEVFRGATPFIHFINSGIHHHS